MSTLESASAAARSPWWHGPKSGFTFRGFDSDLAGMHRTFRPVFISSITRLGRNIGIGAAHGLAAIFSEPEATSTAESAGSILADLDRLAVVSAMTQQFGHSVMCFSSFARISASSVSSR